MVRDEGSVGCVQAITCGVVRKTYLLVG
jgi:hypothetical protein